MNDACPRVTVPGTLTVIPSPGRRRAHVASPGSRTIDRLDVDGGAAHASDRNPGTEARPFRTIQRAAEAVRPGERVLSWFLGERRSYLFAAASGRVRALVGSIDFTHQPSNHVTQGWRQPGSTREE